jgi:hypothetical protein
MKERKRILMSWKNKVVLANGIAKNMNLIHDAE